MSHQIRTLHTTGTSCDTTALHGLVFHNHSKLFFGVLVQISVLASLNNLFLDLSTPQAPPFQILTTARSQMAK